MDSWLKYGFVILVFGTMFSGVLLFWTIMILSVRTDLRFRHLRSTGVFPADTPDFSQGSIEQSWKNIHGDRYFGRDEALDRQLSLQRRLVGPLVVLFIASSLFIGAVALTEFGWRGIGFALLALLQAVAILLARKLHLRLDHKIEAGELPPDTPRFSGFPLPFGGEIHDKCFDKIPDEEIDNLVWALRTASGSMKWMVAVAAASILLGNIIGRD